MYSSYVGENAVFENQYLTGKLEVELTPQVRMIMCICLCLRVCVCLCLYVFVSVCVRT